MINQNQILPKQNLLTKIELEEYLGDYFFSKKDSAKRLFRRYNLELYQFAKKLYLDNECFWIMEKKPLTIEMVGFIYNIIYLKWLIDIGMDWVY